MAKPVAPSEAIVLFESDEPRAAIGRLGAGDFVEAALDCMALYA